MKKICYDIGILGNKNQSFLQIAESLGLFYRKVTKDEYIRDFKILISLNPDKKCNTTILNKCEENSILVTNDHEICEEKYFLEELILPFSAVDYSHINENNIVSTNYNRCRIKKYKHNNTIIILIEQSIINKWENNAKTLKQFVVNHPKLTYLSTPTVRVDKRNIQKYFYYVFEMCFEYFDLPLVTRWRYPKDYDSIFCFRLDCDGGNSDDFQKTIDIVKNDSEIQSWFINVNPYKNESNLVKKVLKKEMTIESHGWLHTLFENKILDKYNITKAHQWLEKKIGIKIEGYATPGFSYDSAIPIILHELGYKYMCSFGKAFNALSFPYFINNRMENFWEIPFFPVSIVGRFISSNGIWDEQLYKQIIESIVFQRHKNGEPHFYYGHPENRIGKYPNSYSILRDAVKMQNNVLWTNLRQYQKFLCSRSTIHKGLFITKNKNHYEIDQMLLEKLSNISIFLHIKKHSNKELKTNNSSVKINYESKPQVGDFKNLIGESLSNSYDAKPLIYRKFRSKVLHSLKLLKT